MSLLVALFAIGSVLLLVALGWLITRPLPRETALELGNNIEDLLPLHTHHFPQLRQSLASADSQYVRRKASKEIERQWRAERRRILQSFLAGLADDFARLDRLARIVAALSPQFSRREELERIWLSLRFRLNYRIVSTMIFAWGIGSMRQLTVLSNLVGNLSAQAEAAMRRLEIAPPPHRMGAGFNA